MKAIITSLVVFMLLYIGAMVLFAEHISPDDLTHTNMAVLEMKIGQFAEEHHSLPAKLSDLKKREGYADSITDGWNREIIYDSKPDGSVTLSSFGKSGKPGGKDSITVKFTVQLPSGTAQK